MSKIAEYIIPYKGLSEKVHLFDFDLDDSFFSMFTTSEIQKGKLTAKIELDRRPNFLVLLIQIEGNVTVSCDRCLEDMIYPILVKRNLIVKFSTDETLEDEDELVYLKPEQELNLAQFFYEFICLSLPYKRTHKKISDCNPEMVKKITIASEHEEIQTDPRWEKLKNFITNNKN